MNWYVQGGIGANINQRVIERIDYALQDTNDPTYSANQGSFIYTYDRQNTYYTDMQVIQTMLLHP